ncbi:hypothetical protein HN499_04730 [archaeon]|nr:hypothetical protein [archaeon]MBT6956202.1 hypothetical protein [archaeon]
MRSKKGELTSEEIIQIILAGAGIVILIILLWTLISSTFDPGEETAKSYQGALEDVMKGVERSGKGSFVLWGGEPKMVYFEGNTRIISGKDVFYEGSRDKNRICFCYESEQEKKDWKCGNCVFLDKPAKFLKQGKDPVNTIDNIYFFKEGDYWKYDNYNGLIMVGYPKKIYNGWSRIPSNLDAAVKYTEISSFFFKGKEYWRYDYDPANNVNKVNVFGNISDGWPGIPGNLDAAVMGLDNQFFFFKGDRYWRYDYGPSINKLISPVDGQKISDEWNGLPSSLKPKAAARYLNYVYLFDGSEYWKFDLDSNKAVHDSPRATSSWAGEFKSLDAAIQGIEVSYRLEEYNLNIFEKGCNFDIFSTEDKYIVNVNCNYLANGK